MSSSFHCSHFFFHSGSERSSPTDLRKRLGERGVRLRDRGWGPHSRSRLWPAALPSPEASGGWLKNNRVLVHCQNLLSGHLVAGRQVDGKRGPGQGQKAKSQVTLPSETWLSVVDFDVPV